MCFAVCSLVEMGNGTALHFTQRFLLASTFRLLGSACSSDRRRTTVYLAVDASLFHFFWCLHFVDMYAYNETCVYIYIIYNCVCVCSFRGFSCWRWGDILVSPLERACNAFLLILGQLFVAKAASPDLDWLAFGKQNSSLWKLSIYRWVMMIYLLKMVIYLLKNGDVWWFTY